VGALLRHQGALTAAQLESAVTAQRESGLKLGAQLKALGHLPADALVKALAAQAGVSYLTAVDLSRVRHAPGGLSADMVRALGLLPFEADDARRRLHVLCTAPLPRAALRALTRLTGWTPEPYLVDDQVWQQAVEAYVPAGGPGTAEVVRDLEVATAHVVRAAASSREATVRYAGGGGFVWARVESAARTQDVLVHAGLEGR
jgi:hypothetical protein